MSSRFLSGGGGDSADVTNGSTAILGASLSAVGLVPNLPIKTDADSRLVTTFLSISDTAGLQTALDATLQTPMSVELDMNSNKIIGLADPTLPQDASTKDYVDGRTLQDIYEKSLAVPQIVTDVTGPLVVQGGY